MTTGHAPDDWLDIPPPPFADSPAAAGTGDLPTGEIQVVDVPDAEPDTDGSDGSDGAESGPDGQDGVDLPESDGPDAGEVEAQAREVGDGVEPTGEMPAVDDPEPEPTETPDEPPSLTMTGQFRAVAAALAAELADPPAAAPAAPEATVEAPPDGPAPEVDGDGDTTSADPPEDAAEAPEQRAWSVPVLRVRQARPEGSPPAPPDPGTSGALARADSEPSTPEASDDRDAETVAGTTAGAETAGVDVASGAATAAGPTAGADTAGAGMAPDMPGAGTVAEVAAGEATTAVTPADGGQLAEAEAAGTEVDDGGGAEGAAEGAVEPAAGARGGGGVDVPVAVGLGSALGPRARRRIEAHRSRTLRLRRQRRLAVAGLAVLVGSGTALGLVGVATVRGSTGGKYVDPKVRPDEPGYVALVTPTPTLLVVHEGADGGLSGVSLLSLHAQDEGGSVIVMPVTTVAPFADVGTTYADAYAENGPEGVKTQVELTLNIVIGETVEVDDLRWATLLDPVAPIELDLEKPVGEWPAGEADIPADQVGAFLTTRTDSETELARLDRQELFWETWLPLVRAGGRNAVPGEVDVGLGRFVRGLAAGDTEVTGLPVSAAFSNEEMYGPTEEMLPDLVAQAVPYPQEPSRGSRVQTQLLNGTTQRDLIARAATSLVAGGAEIALVGNAASFSEPTTRFVYANVKLRDDAEKLRDAFGVGEVVQAPPDDDALPVEDDRIDVTVILGADALDVLGG